jgi:hypothetical protein
MRDHFLIWSTYIPLKFAGKLEFILCAKSEVIVAKGQRKDADNIPFELIWALCTLLY